MKPLLLEQKERMNAAKINVRMIINFKGCSRISMIWLIGWLHNVQNDWDEEVVLLLLSLQQFASLILFFLSWLPLTKFVVTTTTMKQLSVFKVGCCCKQHLYWWCCLLCFDSAIVIVKVDNRCWIAVKWNYTVIACKRLRKEKNLVFVAVFWCNELSQNHGSNVHFLHHMVANCNRKRKIKKVINCSTILRQ